MSVPPRLPRRIAHFDLDTFFVAVERARDPSLVGKPVLVGGRPPRGVVSAASYEARAFGCHSAQPMVQAMRLCPQAIVLPPDFAAYREVSERFHEMLRSVSPLVESVGIDEAYVDLTGIAEGRPPGAGAASDPAIDAAFDAAIDAAGASDGARRVAEEVRARVRGELRVAVSACIAGSRTTAKVGSDRAKPDGLIVVPPGGDAAFLAPLPVRDLPSVGPKLGAALHASGLRRIGEVAAQDPRWLAERFGRAGVVLAERARGIDPRPVVAGRRPNRQVSREVTFGEDVTDRAELGRVLTRHAERVAADLRHADRRARTVTLKLRWNDFSTVTRSHTLDRPVRAVSAIAEAAQALLDAVIAERGMRPVRLIGLGVTNLADDAMQLGFDDALAGGEPRDERLDGALEAVRDRFGRDAVRRGLPRTRPRE